jgi:3-isopropylmalate/(R)-2-methylmalate dehydratase large subunit
MGKTVTEKIFESHVVDRPAEDVWVLRLDAVLCHEITTPTAILDLMSLGKDRGFDPSRIKAVIDHVSPAKDSNTATQGKVLREWARRRHITDFFDIGRNRTCLPAACWWSSCRVTPSPACSQTTPGLKRLRVISDSGAATFES